MVKKREKLPNLMTYLTWNTKNKSITDDMTQAARTMHAQAQGLDKPHRTVTLTFVKATTLDTRQHSSLLGARQTHHPLLVKTIAPDKLPRHRTNSLDTGQSSFSTRQPLSPVN